MISIILLVVAGVFNAIMDTVQYNYEISLLKIWVDKLGIYDFFDRDSLNNVKNWFKWIPMGIKKTILVPLFDSWHLAKVIVIILVSCSSIYYTPIINKSVDIAILYISWSVSFEFWFRLLSNKNLITGDYK